MQLLLSQLWIEYLPDTDNSFLKELNESWCNLVLDLITTKNETKRNELRKKIDQLIVQWRHNIDLILHQADSTILIFREKIWKEEDDKSIVELEEMMKNM
jgi:hypothetical protein